MTVHRERHSKEMTNFINRVCTFHRIFYFRIKVFGVLSSTFCGSWNKSAKHRIFPEGCALLVQYNGMENRHPLIGT